MAKYNAMILAIALATVFFTMPAMAKVPPCVPSISLESCTSAQRSAHYGLEDPTGFHGFKSWFSDVYDQTGDFLPSVSQDTRDALNRLERSYIKYLRRIVDGYVPNDQELKQAEQELRQIAQEINMIPHIASISFIYGVANLADIIVTSFSRDDIFPPDGDTNKDLDNVMFQGNWGAALTSLSAPKPLPCGLAVCPLQDQDRVARLLGGKENDKKKQLIYRNGVSHNRHAYKF